VDAYLTLNQYIPPAAAPPFFDASIAKRKSFGPDYFKASITGHSFVADYEFYLYL
jgi:hypothetical protein